MSDKLAEAVRLESKARELREAARREERQQQLKREKAFETTGIEAYTSDDYSGLEVGRFRFYYGYEETVPERPGDDEDSEWAFTARLDGKEVLRIPTSALHPREHEEPLFYLVAGIGHFLKSQAVSQ